jgi:ABC-type uncharacterized transport system auxiliary subunit
MTTDRASHVMRWLVFCITLSALTACGSLVETQRPADEVYWLEPLAGELAAASGAVPIQLQVSAVPGLDTDRVLLLNEDARLSQLGLARWPDYLPELLNSVLRRSLQGAGMRVLDDSVGRDEDDCMLRIEVQSFFARSRQGNAHSAEVQFAATLTCGADEWALALVSTQPTGSDASNVVAALQHALNEVSGRLINEIRAVPASS